MKRSFPIILYFFIILNSSFCQKKNITSELSFFGGIKYGEISKQLFINDKNTKVSELTWEQKPLYELGLSGALSFKKVNLKLSACAGLPLETGKMYDSDWNTEGIKTTYSISNITVQQSFGTELRINKDFSLPHEIKIMPELNLQYMFQNFIASNGYGWYGGYQYAKDNRDYDVPWYSPEARKAKKLRDIEYWRHTVLFFTGIYIEINPCEKVTLNTGFYISPFDYIHSLDTHHRSEENTHYMDKEFGYFTKFKTRAGITWKAFANVNLFMDFAYIFGFNDFGNFYTDHYSTTLTPLENQPVSAGINLITYHLGARVKIY